ncbi:hypothetical protein [Lacrimispora sp.]|nr:hypothetical protein [Lacrimispora sp.]
MNNLEKPWLSMCASRGFSVVFRPADHLHFLPFAEDKWKPALGKHVMIP